MHRTNAPVAPLAHLTLRAHAPAPARVELVYRPAVGRMLRSILSIALCWGAVPFILWIPPHYPWVAAAFLGGAFLAHRSWKGRYTILSFAGICPRCGSPLSLGVERTVDLPHTLTCFSCHFEPRLEIASTERGSEVDVRNLPLHRAEDCVGRWRIRWLADEPFIFCDSCRGGVPATREGHLLADTENEWGELLARLTDEGRPLI